MTWSCPITTYSLKWGDFDGDGRPDLICIHKTVGDIWVASYNITSYIATPINSALDPGAVREGYVGTAWSTASGSAPCLGQSGDALSCADFDGDGKADLICSRYGLVWVTLSNGASLTLLNNVQNSQNIGFYRKGYVGTVYDGDNFSGLQHHNFLFNWADFNGDGKADYVRYGNYWEDDVFVYLSTGAGVVPINANTGYVEGAFPQWTYAQYVGNDFQSSDFNGDGKADIIAFNTGSSNTYVAISNGTGTLPLAEPRSAPTQTDYYGGKCMSCFSGSFAKAWVDFDEDDKADGVCYDGYTVNIFYSSNSYSPFLAGPTIMPTKHPTYAPVVPSPSTPGPTPNPTLPTQQPTPYPVSTGGINTNAGGSSTGDDSDSSKTTDQVWFQVLIPSLITVCGGLIVAGIMKACNAGPCKTDPIGIQLDPNKEIGLISYETSDTYFRYNESEAPKKTSWVGQNDAILVYDYDGTQKIENGNKIVLTRWNDKATTDFEALLMAFDSNNDLIFDKRDDEFAKFAVWQDKNQNGKCEKGEFSYLYDVGIVSLNFTKTLAASVEQQEQGILNTAEVLWEDGMITKAYDLVFTHD